MHFSLRHVACTRTRPLARPAAATTAASLPSPLTHDAHSSPRPVCRPGAGVGVVTAPPQHASWPRAGRPWRPLTGPSGPQPPPHAAGEGRAGCGRVGGVCCVRAAASAAGGAAGRPPRAHRLGGRLGADLAPREIDLVRGLQRHRGGSGRAGAGLAVGHSHPGAGLTAGDAFMAPSSSPARAHVRTCHFYDISRLCEIVRVVTVSGGCPNASYVRLICFP